MRLIRLIYPPTADLPLLPLRSGLWALGVLSGFIPLFGNPSVCGYTYEQKIFNQERREGHEVARGDIMNRRCSGALCGLFVVDISAFHQQGMKSPC